MIIALPLGLVAFGDDAHYAQGACRPAVRSGEPAAIVFAPGERRPDRRRGARGLQAIDDMIGHALAIVLIAALPAGCDHGLVTRRSALRRDLLGKDAPGGYFFKVRKTENRAGIGTIGQSVDR